LHQLQPSPDGPPPLTVLSKCALSSVACRFAYPLCSDQDLVEIQSHFLH
jgi:hypothetical protein